MMSADEKEQKRERTRRRIVDELLSTEKSYVDSLLALETVIIAPLQQHDLLSSEQMATLFSNIQVL